MVMGGCPLEGMKVDFLVKAQNSSNPENGIPLSCSISISLLTNEEFFHSWEDIHGPYRFSNSSPLQRCRKKRTRHEKRRSEKEARAKK